MDRLFAVVRSRGDRWDPARPMEAQDEWPAHAAFMNALLAEGFVLLGGPLEGTSDVLLIIRAAGAPQIVSRLAEDPWTARGLLRVARMGPWTLRLGSLG